MLALFLALNLSVPQPDADLRVPSAELRALETRVDALLEVYRDVLHALIKGGRLDAKKAGALYLEAQARGMELTSAVTELTTDLARLAPVSGKREVQLKLNRTVGRIVELLREQSAAQSHAAIEAALEQREDLAFGLVDAGNEVRVSVLRALRKSALTMEPRRFAWPGREQMLHTFRQMQLLLDPA